MVESERQPTPPLIATPPTVSVRMTALFPVLSSISLRSTLQCNTQSLGKKMLQRLNTNQRVTKMDLMSADLSVIATAKRGRIDDNSANAPTGGGVGGGVSAVGDPRTWLVIYCGANAKVEKVIHCATTDRLCRLC